MKNSKIEKKETLLSAPGTIDRIKFSKTEEKSILHLITTEEKNDFLFKMFFIGSEQKYLSLFNKIKYTFSNKFYCDYKKIYVCGDLIGSEIIYHNLRNKSFTIKLLFSNRNCKVHYKSNQILVIYYKNNIKKLFEILFRLKTDKTEHTIKKIIFDINQELRKDKKSG